MKRAFRLIGLDLVDCGMTNLGHSDDPTEAFVAPFDLPSDFSAETYTIVGGQLVPAPAELIVERLAVKVKTTALVEIKELQAYLTSTDYAAIKCGELGLAMADTYPEIYARRSSAREHINKLQELYNYNR